MEPENYHNVLKAYEANVKAVLKATTEKQGHEKQLWRDPCCTTETHCPCALLHREVRGQAQQEQVTVESFSRTL